MASLLFNLHDHDINMISTVLPLKMLLNVFYNIIDKYALKMKSGWRQLTNPTADIQEAIYNYNVGK